MSVTELFPLIKAPAAWPVPVIAAIAMVLLAALDLAGAVAAKEWADNGSVRGLVLGSASFLVLWWVYASSLRYAELSLVTMGWIVMLQVGLLLIDRWRYGVELPMGKWVAIVVVLVAQGYLLLAPTATAATQHVG